MHYKTVSIRCAVFENGIGKNVIGKIDIGKTTIGKNARR